jgi:AraC-like DNA-binding protein
MESKNIINLYYRKEYYDIIFDIIVYIHENFMKKIKICDICKMYGINRSLLNKYFNSITGYSFYHYLIDLRLEASKFYLYNTSNKIADISEKCGFFDESHYIKAFEHKYGTSPSKLKRADFTVTKN